MDLEHLVIIAAAIAAGAIAKGATGMGLPLVALPIMALFLETPHAITVVLLPAIVTNAWQGSRFLDRRRDPSLGFLGPFLAAGFFGVMVGTWALVAVPERGLELGLGLLLLAYVLLRLTRPSFRVGPRAAMRGALPAGFGAGILQGATGISAPLGVTFIHAMRLFREAHLLAVSAMFLLFAVVHGASLAVAGVLRPAWVLESAFAVLPALAFMPVGAWLARRLSAAAFDRLILGFLALMGTKMTLGL